jgi:recombination protein RecA
LTTIDEVLSKINSTTAEKFRAASQLKNELLPTPSLKLNMAMGGFGYGRQSTLWGNRGSGKTAMLLQTCAAAQKEGRSVAWIDAEKNYDPIWAKRLGVDTDAMHVSHITSIADMADAGSDLIRAGIDILVVDSVSILLPQSYFEDPKDKKKAGEMKGLAHVGQIGTFSKNLGSAMNMFNNINEHTAILLISQVRNKITQVGGIPSIMGGEALAHINSTQLKLWGNPNVKEAITEEVVVGDLIMNKPVAREITWTIEKNRGPGMNMSDNYDFYFAGNHVGIDRTGEVLDFAVVIGAVKKSGAWYYFDDAKEIKAQGRPAAVSFLRDNPGLENDLYDNIMERMA